MLAHEIRDFRIFPTYELDHAKARHEETAGLLREIAAQLAEGNALKQAKAASRGVDLSLYLPQSSQHLATDWTQANEMGRCGNELLAMLFGELEIVKALTSAGPEKAQQLALRIAALRNAIDKYEEIPF